MGAILATDEKGRLHVNCKGALSWPRTSDGFVCVVGQDKENGIRRVLGECYESNMDNLAKRLNSWERLFDMKYWYAQCEGDNRIFLDMLYDIGREQDKIYTIIQSRIPEDLGVAIQLVRRCFNQNSLELRRDGHLEAKIKQLDQHDLTKSGIESEFVEVGVLASIVYEFPTPERFIEENRTRDGWGDWNDPDDGRGNWMGW